MKAITEPEERSLRDLPRRLLWVLALWLGGVAAVAALSYGVKFLLGL